MIFGLKFKDVIGLHVLINMILGIGNNSYRAFWFFFPGEKVFMLVALGLNKPNGHSLIEVGKEDQILRAKTSIIVIGKCGVW